ncbi:hypothetical protein Hanom_Chr07g00650341 [Helianthus anomalus]
MRRKVRVTSTMFTMKFANSLSVCVCVSGRKLSISLMCVKHEVSAETYTCMGIYTQHQMVWPKDSIDGPKDHLSITSHSKDNQ